MFAHVHKYTLKYRPAATIIKTHLHFLYFEENKENVCKVLEAQCMYVSTAIMYLPQYNLSDNTQVITKTGSKCDLLRQTENRCDWRDMIANVCSRQGT